MMKQIDRLIEYKATPRFLALAFILSVLNACTESNFSGAAGRRPGPNGDIKKCKTPPCEVGPTPPVRLDMEFSGDKKIEPLQNNKIWTATTTGIIKRFTVEGDTVVGEPDVWLGGGGTYGMRTYVTEGGFMGARSPWLYFIDPNQPGVIAKKKNLGISSELRICIASYMKGGQRFMIAAWGDGSFREYAMDDKPPFAPKWDEQPTKADTLGTGLWGYSCFIDQAKKIFYSQSNTSGTVIGLDLNNYKAADVSETAPNGKFTSITPNVIPYAKGRVKTSYAMSGDSYGNVYNGPGYTSAYDKASDSVWFSNGGTITVIDRKCLTTQTTCANFHEYSQKENGGSLPVIGPLSPLKDGRIVGVSKRGRYIYLMKLKDKSNLKSGLVVKEIGDSGGDTYIYTDFTGATLYINESEQTFKPVDMPKFVSSKPIKSAVFKWTPTVTYAAGNLSVEWKNIKLEARCYSNAASKPAFVEIAKVHPSDKGTELNVPSCSEGKYEHVDIKLTQLNNDSSLAGIETISVGFKQ